MRLEDADSGTGLHDRPKKPGRPKRSGPPSSPKRGAATRPGPLSQVDLIPVGQALD